MRKPPSPSLWERFHFLLFVLAGLGVIIFGLVYYFSPLTRLNLYGVRLDQRVAAEGQENYLLGWASHLTSWTERDGRLDTPLIKETCEETSTLGIERVGQAPDHDTLLARPQEWIRSLENGEGYKNFTLPLTHPSIANGTILMDAQGTLLERGSVNTPLSMSPGPAAGWRVGRALQFLFPKFPKGVLHTGSRWTEHLAWTDTVSGWTIDWQADVKWRLEDMEMRYEKPCVRLRYEATLEPTVLAGPEWAKGEQPSGPFTGQGGGEALYDVKKKLLISNTFSYGGLIRLHLPNLDMVPEDLRVGLMTNNSAGDIALKIENKIDVRLP